MIFTIKNICKESLSYTGYSIPNRYFCVYVYPITKKALSGTTWKNKVSDPTMEFSSQYTFKFKSNGKVQLRGWRNKDTGTYKIIKGKKIKATFTSLYCDFPGSGWEKVNGRYTATLTVDLSKRRLKCKFNGLTDSNAQDGYYYRR